MLAAAQTESARPARGQLQDGGRTAAAQHPPRSDVGVRRQHDAVAIDDVGNRGEANVAINYMTTATEQLPPPTDTGITTIDALWNTSGTAPF